MNHQQKDYLTLKQAGKKHSGSRHFMYCNEVQNPICEPPVSGMVMLEKGAIQKVIPTQRQFLSNLLLVEKRNEGNRPVINSKDLNRFIPCEHSFPTNVCIVSNSFWNMTICYARQISRRCIFQFPSKKAHKRL